MAVRRGSILRFASHVLDVDARELRSGDRVIGLQPKAFAILLHLAENAGRAVSRAELLEVVWAGVHVEEAALYQAVSQLRAALRSEGTALVRTVRSFGYRLGAPVEVLPATPPSPRAASPLAGFLGPEAAGSFVGRAPELARLEVLAASVEAGAAGLAVLSGESGIGKTRLATELALAWSARGGEVLGGRCLDAAQGAYEPFEGAIADVVGRTLADDLAARLAPRPEELARLVPEITRRLPDLPAPIASEPATQRFALHEAVLGWLARTASGRPTLLVLDDLQWADPATLALLTHLVSGGLAPGLLLLALHRPVEAGAPLADALREAGAAKRLALALEGLPARAVQQLVGDRESPWSGDDLRAWTGGNPFFVLEVLRAGAHGTAPPRVHDVVRSRVAGLGTESADVLTAAAVLGAHFDAARLAEVAGVSPERVAEVLEAARKASLAVVGPGAPGTWRFAHDIARDALLAELSPRRRAALHGRALEVFEGGAGPTEPGAVAAAAYHAAGAGRRGSAIEHHRRLGELRLRGLAPREAADAFQTALHWLDQEPGDREGPLACDLWIGLAVAQGQCGVEEHWNTARRAAEIARSLGDPERLGRAALSLARPGAGGFVPHVWRVEALRGAAEGLVDGHDPELALRVRTALLGDVQEAEFEASRAQAASITLERDAEALGDPALLAAVLAVRFYTHTELAEREARLEVANRLAQAARRANDPALISLATTLQARALFTAGRVAEADVVIESAIEAADRTGRAHARGMARHLVANRMRIRGRFAEARALADEALAIHREGGVADAVLMHGFAEFSRRMEVGEFDRAAEALARVVEGRPLPNTRAGLAVALAEQGRCDEARWQLDALLAGDPRTSTRRELELTGATLSAWASAQANHRPAAEHWLAQLAPHGRAYAFSVFSFTGFVGHHVGALLATLGRAEEAIPLLEEAVERYRRDDAPVWEARACRDLARALGSRGADGDRARISELRARAPGGAV